MNEFWVGQKVVCVDDRPGLGGKSNPLIRGTKKIKLGDVYTITALVPGRIDMTLDKKDQVLAEIAERPVVCPSGPRYGLWRFQPLQSKAISIFRAIAANPHIKIKDRQDA